MEDIFILLQLGGKYLGLRGSERQGLLSGPGLGSRVGKVTALLAACLPAILGLEEL